MNSRLLVILSVCAAMLAAGAARVMAERRRAALAPEALAAGIEGRSATLGQLNSFALGLLLGGLRGPLVMALWSSSEGQKTERDLEDFDTKVELIRLLQPQFDSVHLYQIWNKAYNVSVEMANLASKYTAILDAVDYGRKVLAERPANIDLETQLGEIFNNKLGGSQEADYYKLRIHEETQADQPVVKITFSIGREPEFRDASRRAGVSPRRLLIRHTEDPTKLMAAVRRDVADGLRPLFSGDDVSYEQLAPRQVGARGVSGPLRLEPMLDGQGNLLPALVTPRRSPQGRDPGTYLDGSSAQFLRDYAPFPEGVSPHALAYNHFMTAYVLQMHAGQRHMQAAEASVQANPGRALRSWALAAFVEARLLEAEGFGRDVSPPGEDGELQAELEREVADVPLDSEPVSPELLRQAIHRYQRSVRMCGEAQAWLQRLVQEYPEARSTFDSNIGRLQGLQTLLEADLLYAQLLAHETSDPAQARWQAEALYLKAHREMLDFVMRHHASAELLPAGMRNDDVMQQPIWFKWQVLDTLRRERDLRGDAFEHTRTINEFDGYFDRIVRRLARLREAGVAG